MEGEQQRIERKKKQTRMDQRHIGKKEPSLYHQDKNTVLQETLTVTS
jgi:hypothetical protein